MKVLGVEMDSNRLSYVLLSGADGETADIVTNGKLALEQTRDAPSARSFAEEIKALFDGSRPDRVAVKSKPENGQMRAGAAALKMEAILLASSPCEVIFISSQRLKKVDGRAGLFAYQVDAGKAAEVGFDYVVPKQVAKKKIKSK